MPCDKIEDALNALKIAAEANHPDIPHAHSLPQNANPIKAFEEYRAAKHCFIKDRSSEAHLIAAEDNFRKTLISNIGRMMVNVNSGITIPSNDALSVLRPFGDAAVSLYVQALRSLNDRDVDGLGHTTIALANSIMTCRKMKTALMQLSEKSYGVV